ncbi:sensor histidine kinase [Mucilaginibacter conchicola]|nr:sensor histidine kinase [Mucilaginibacter conchicola]
MDLVVKSAVFRHVVFWALYITYELAFYHINSGTRAPVIHFVVFYLLNIGLFYFNAHVILDFAFFRTRLRFMNSAALIILELTIYLFVKYVLDNMISGIEGTPGVVKFTKQYSSYSIWRGLYFIGLSIAYWSMIYMEHFRERNHRITAEQLRTKAENLELENRIITVENAFLKNQISPHLLFNTLNFIYNDVYHKSERAGEGVMLLSELMRYSLVSGDSHDQVPLSDEIRQVENLIRLCRLRFGDQVFFNFRRKGKLTGIKVIPLIFVTLVENMIKHGDIGEESCPATVELIRMDDELIFRTSNPKGSSLPSVRTGLGLKNLEKRLHNAYENRYRFEIADLGDIFSAAIYLKI